MMVHCCAERLDEANRFEPFTLHHTGLRRVITEIAPDPIDISAGHLAVEASVDSEEIVGSLVPPAAGTGSVCITHGPGGTASAFGVEHFGGTGGYLL